MTPTNYIYTTVYSFEIFPDVGPIQNIVANGQESARSISCTAALSFNHSKEIFDLLHKPFTNAFKNIQVSLSQTRKKHSKKLLFIQKELLKSYHIQMKRNSSMFVSISTLHSNHGKIIDITVTCQNEPIVQPNFLHFTYKVHCRKEVSWHSLSK